MYLFNGPLAKPVGAIEALSKSMETEPEAGPLAGS
jgi:hypothetical protein